MMLKQIQSEIRWCLYRVGSRLRSRAGRIERLFHAPSLPKNPDGKIFIHLGCGDIASPEFINVDIRPAPHIHYVRDVVDLSIFPDDFADLVYACHILEHLSPDRIKEVLWEWKRVVKPGGLLRLSVPDFDKIIEVYQARGRDVKAIKGALLGVWGPYTSHGMIFNESYLRDLLSGLGFIRIREWDPATADHHDFKDWASNAVVRDGKDYVISLNLEAVKRLEFGPHA